MPFAATLFFIFSKRTVIDDRVCRIVIDIYYRSKVNVNTGALHLAGEVRSHLIDKLIVAYCAKRHLVGVTDRAVEPHSESPFSVHCN